MLRSRTILVLIAAMAVAVWLWQEPIRNLTRNTQLRLGPRILPGQPLQPTATGTDGRAPPPASTAADARPTFAAPAAPDPGVTASNAGPAPAAPSASVRLDVRAPPSARAGERFTVTIDAEALGGIRNLSFAVIYDRDVLDFVSSSPGSFVQQASAPATLSAEDTSAGNVLREHGHQKRGHRRRGGDPCRPRVQCAASRDLAHNVERRDLSGKRALERLHGRRRAASLGYR